ncbi:polymeric immunoglobulin receptor-like isoform X2 [Micropterus salmoides]|uniref:polymeric immunoglobulin receptor-like isoform X2 n=1 Tax=Micropterus salmoides TaxID=27706 RepID=UPI0018EC2F06|nr:polymeric immunoglobulin receptor-like isoform X2 [Micropterus salmoides]
MKVRHTLICFFFLSLQDGNTGLTNALIPPVFTGTEGGDVTVRCAFSSPRSSMFFCKRECKRDDILIHTTGVRDQRGRYSIIYERGGNVFVSITQLTKSDSGLYRCGLDRSNIKFEIIVVDALLDGSPPEVKSLYTRAGGNIVVECSFTVSGSRRYFCKEECEEKDILVETTGYTAERGRYSIRSLTDVSVYVSITQLTKSDSGRYRCGLDRRFSPDPYREFEIIVTDAPNTLKPKSTLPVFSTSDPSASTPTQISQTNQQPIETGPSQDVWLPVGLTLAVMVILLLLAVVIYCRKRSSKPKGAPVETEYPSVTETNQVYENIREDRHSRSAPVEISSVYTLAKYTKQKTPESTDDYSSVSASRFQNTAEDHSSKLTYSEVNFSKPSNRAVRGDDDNVVYSVPRVEASSDAGHLEDDSPVYSTVT